MKDDKNNKVYQPLLPSVDRVLTPKQKKILLSLFAVCCVGVVSAIYFAAKKNHPEHAAITPIPTALPTLEPTGQPTFVPVPFPDLGWLRLFFQYMTNNTFSPMIELFGQAFSCQDVITFNQTRNQFDNAVWQGILTLMIFGGANCTNVSWLNATMIACNQSGILDYQVDNRCYDPGSIPCFANPTNKVYSATTAVCEDMQNNVSICADVQRKWEMFKFFMQWSANNTNYTAAGNATLTCRR